MKLKFKFMIFILLTFSLALTNKGILYAKENNDLFNKLLSQDDIMITECSVTATFNSKEKDIILCKEISSNVSNILGHMEYTSTDENGLVTISFSNELYKGSIVSRPYNGESIVSITVIKKENKNNTKELQGKLSEILSQVNSRMNYSQCIKGKILNNNLDEMNKFVIDTLEQNKAENVNTAKLYNGYSTICNAKLYNSKKIGGLDIDFQCAVVKYSSGCYLIMGTPEITLAY